MKKSITPILLVLLMLGSQIVVAADAENHQQHHDAAAQKPYSHKTPKLNKTQIDALLAKPGDLLIVDVRRPDEISKIGSFPVYLNVQADALEAGLPFIPKERSIVTVSNHANRAGAAGDFLAEKGFKVVGAIGSQNYEEEGGKIARIVPPEPKK